MKPGEFLLHVFHASLLKGVHVFFMAAKGWTLAERVFLPE